jgi:tetratricopeptide (TPR) repeat protein
MNSTNDDSSCSSDDSDVAFAFVNFDGVDFCEEEEDISHEKIQGDEKDDKDRSICENDQRTTASVEKLYTSDQNDVTNKTLVDACNVFMMGKEKSTKNEKSEPLRNLSSELASVSYEKVHADEIILDEEAKLAIKEEEHILLKNCYLGGVEDGKDSESVPSSIDESGTIGRIRESSKLLSQGHYIKILNGPTSVDLFIDEEETPDVALTVAQKVRRCVLRYCTTVAKCVEVELFAVAALNLFIQLNYTGPSIDHGGVVRPGKEDKISDSIQSINPHSLFVSCLKHNRGQSEEDKDDSDNKAEDHKENLIDTNFRNAVHAELSVDGEWPCPVSKYPYFLLLARSILSTLADPNRPDWGQYFLEDIEHEVVIRKQNNGNFYEPPSAQFVACAESLSCAPIWCARAIVAHSRLLQCNEPSVTLWRAAKKVFDVCLMKYCENVEKDEENDLACKTLLEYGLAQHHFDREKKGKPYFLRALGHSNLNVEVTGAEGRRTKYQKKATAQMLVKAKPTKDVQEANDSVNKENIGKQEVKLEEDTILLDRVKYVDDGDNVHFQLNILQQTVLLALCLDVKNDNPMDGLTAEQMGAYLERVLQQHDDWMVYATGLLERAWLESERNHTRERALLQLQALADQHTNRLTFTQSTFQAAVEDSAPPQERLRNIHYIVYPPRWGALRDLAERYAKIGIVTSAAEIFEEIELWDEVVECYRRAGKEKKAEEVVRKRLKESETPRMWSALGDITGDTSCYEKALELSNGKFSSAYVALGKYYAEKGDLSKAVEQYKMAVHIKPLSPHVWFRLGTLSMRLEDWETALQAFTEVVQQEPEEGDAWANVAAIHMHNKNPQEAYPALNEVSEVLHFISLLLTILTLIFPSP